MALQMIGTLMISDRTVHTARSVGQDGWVVSYLPGRTLGLSAAVGALLIAELATEIASTARPLGLTAPEAVGLSLLTPRALDRASQWTNAT
ncbi:hypothetical protein [Nocardia macrotermitis]|uniref:Uncharacterized protein n=1 Tax=Nocardia macrotermitis TaxID=2585198 RepID=A0A7K0D642_9NOCA|nr:hypothetical protein [Nocardia macrotermitis]MQY21226.1 hypothetical protein [Nocardia macrotermitis]